MATTPKELNSKTCRVTHNITSVVSGDIQTASSDIDEQNIIYDSNPGYNFLELYYYVVAPGGASTTPLVTLYKKLDNGQFAQIFTANAYSLWTKGKTLPTTPIVVAAGQTLVPSFIEVVYVGSGDIAVTLSQCTDATRIVIAAKRVPGNYIQQ